jgi:hypothetical protein
MRPEMASVAPRDCSAIRAGCRAVSAAHRLAITGFRPNCGRSARARGPRSAMAWRRGQKRVSARSPFLSAVSAPIGVPLCRDRSPGARTLAPPVARCSCSWAALMCLSGVFEDRRRLVAQARGARGPQAAGAGKEARRPPSRPGPIRHSLKSPGRIARIHRVRGKAKGRQG